MTSPASRKPRPKRSGRPKQPAHPSVPGISSRKECLGTCFACLPDCPVHAARQAQASREEDRKTRPRRK